MNLEDASEASQRESVEEEVQLEDSEVKTTPELDEMQAEKPTDQEDQTVNEKSLEDGKSQKQDAGEQEEDTQAESED